ncbi:MSCRAMM family adhesin SdrC [Halosolutus halophilus]|uniref:MSCRAMM family adhesin SdrC n=1 Tax=Halosolutus halophilus TaxID=1552990 RepID=UPI00223504A0|nr:MSCRAMM family adhesin SdrC [Halosolutus halophilus]
MPRDGTTRRHVLKGVAGGSAATAAGIGGGATAASSRGAARGQDGGIAIAIRTANDPVEAGEFLRVDARFENAGSEPVTETIRFVVGHDPTTVDSGTVQLDSGESETITLGFETALVRNNQQFPVRVEGETDTAERSVLVYGTEGGPTGDIAVRILETDHPVDAGEYLEVLVELAPVDGPAAGEVRFVVGHDPTEVDSRGVTLESGETESVTLGFETALVRNNQQFPVRAVTDADESERSVLVYGTEDGPDGGDVAVRIRGTNHPVGAGEVLDVTAELENVGTGTVTERIDFVVGHDPTTVDSETVQLDPGEAETITLQFETALVRNTQEFPVRVRSDVDEAVRTVRVFGTDDGPDGTLAVRILETNDPVDAGEVLDVTAELEAVDGAATGEVRLVVGHDPTTVDSESVSLGPGETETVTLEFETALVENDQEFPVRVRSDADEAVRSVLVYGTGDDQDEFSVTFPSCTRAVVRVGRLEDGESVAASTGFYNLAGDGEPLYGNTIMEDWIEAGRHVDAPFTGTIVFEVGDDPGVSGGGGRATVVVPDYGDLGPVITGITDPEGYPTATITHPNPQAESCLNDLVDGGRLAVSIVGTNDPVESGEVLDVTAELENVGTAAVTRTVRLIVGHDPTVVDSESVSLGPGETGTITLQFETALVERTQEFPARVESDDDSAVRTVTVIGTAETDTDDESTTEADQAADADGESDDEPVEDPDGPDEDTDADGPSAEPGEDGDDEAAGDSGGDTGTGDSDGDAETDDSDGDTETDDSGGDTGTADSDGNNGDGDPERNADEGGGSENESTGG